MNEQLEAHLAKARQNLRSADLLRNLTDYNAAASRLYGAMFHLAEAALLRKGLVLKTDSAVLAGFDHNLIKSGELPSEMYAWLAGGFDNHQIAEQGQSSLSDEDLRELQLNANDFVERVEQWLRTQEK